MRSRKMIWMISLRMFFVFEGLWQKFFRVLEAWIRKASSMCNPWSFWRLLGLISANFKISIGSLDDFASNILCIWRLKFLKFLEASRLDSNRASILLNLLWCCLWHGCLGVLQDFSQDVLVYRNALGRLLFIGV